MKAASSRPLETGRTEMPETSMLLADMRSSVYFFPTSASYQCRMSGATEKLHKLLGLLPQTARRRLTQRAFRLTRALTLGVRGLVFDEESHVLLVRHTYQSGWMLPGGGVEFRESAEAALAHELLDEAGIEMTARPALFGIYDNRAVFPGDHVLLYVLRPGQYVRHPWQPNAEIAELGFFASEALPADTTDGTRRRIAEVLEGAPPSVQW